MGAFAQKRIGKTSTLATIASGGIAVVVVLHALKLVALELQIADYEAAPRASWPRQADDPLVTGLTLIGALAWYASGAIFLGWIASAHRTIKAIREDEQGPTPGWAVGAYFVPFLNLIRPYQDMAMLAHLSDPRDLELPTRVEADPGAGYRQQAVRVVAPAPWSPPPGVVGLWWASYLACTFSGVLVGIGTQRDGVSRMHGMMVQDALFVASGLLCLGVVQGINACMKERARRAEILAAPAP